MQRGPGTSSWHRGPALERVAIRVSGIGLGNVETCDNTATTDTGDSMGGCPTIRKQTAPPAISRPRGYGLRLLLEFRLLDLDRFSHYLVGHDSRHVS